MPTAPADDGECCVCAEVLLETLLLPCLHGVCRLCAHDVARADGPRCPACGEPLVPLAIWQALDAPCPATAATDPADAAENATRILLGAMRAADLLERVRAMLAEAQDLADFASHNEASVLADIRCAYAALPSSRNETQHETRQHALLVEAGARLAAERKGAALAAEHMSDVYQRALELRAHYDVALRTGTARAHVDRLGSRHDVLSNRCDAHVPGLASATYFACIRPLTADNAQHAHLARTLVWHARWAAPDRAWPDAWDTGVQMRPAGATPDGLLVLVPPVDGSVREGPPLLVAAGPTLTRTGAQTFAFSGKRQQQNVFTDGASNVWLSDGVSVLCFGPTDAWPREATALQVIALWHFEDLPDTPSHAEIRSLVVAACGVVVLQMLCIYGGCSGQTVAHKWYVVGLAPNLTPLWRRWLNMGHDIAFHTGLSVAGDVVIVQHTRVFATQALPLALDAHTGQPCALPAWLPAPTEPDCEPAPEPTRRGLLQHLPTPLRRPSEDLADADTSGEDAPRDPAGHKAARSGPGGRVLRLCDLVRPHPLAKPRVVLGPLGRMYTSSPFGIVVH